MLRDSLAVHRIFGAVGSENFWCLVFTNLSYYDCYCYCYCYCYYYYYYSQPIVLPGVVIFSRSPEPFQGTYFFRVSSRFWSLSFPNRLCCCYLLLFVSVCVCPYKVWVENMRVWEHESMRERHYGTMILWYCEILPLLCYDSMRHDALIMLW